MSVSQVLFPRVVEAVAKEEHPGRILLSSAGILTLLGAGALLVFLVLPGVVVGVLFGRTFDDAIPYVFAVGVIGLALSLDNLLVQFFMAVHDRVFLPILAAGVIAEGGLIVARHGSVGEVVADVLVSLLPHATPHDSCLGGPIPDDLFDFCSNYPEKIGRRDWIRTSDPLLPKQVLYKAEPRAV